MYLRYYLDENGKRVYTLQVVLEDGSYTLNAHPARFSPDDKFSKERIQCKERFQLLLTQSEEPKL
jgi:H/ACA ribonucleoprotein complex subunit 3